MNEEFLDDLINGVIEHPRVQGVFHRVSSTVDKFAQMIDAVVHGKVVDPPSAGYAETPRNGNPKTPPFEGYAGTHQQHSRPWSSAFRPRPRPVRPPDWMYAILGFVPGEALSTQGIRDRKIMMAQIYHPDKHVNKPAADQMKFEEQFKRLGIAAQTLTDFAEGRWVPPTA